MSVKTHSTVQHQVHSPRKFTQTKYFYCQNTEVKWENNVSKISLSNLNAAFFMTLPLIQRFSPQKYKREYYRVPYVIASFSVPFLCVFPRSPLMSTRSYHGKHFPAKIHIVLTDLVQYFEVMIMTVWGFLYFDFSPFAVSLDSSLNCEK
jgi:hypothetical protein